MKALTLKDIICLLLATMATTAMGLIIPAISRWVYKDYISGLSPALFSFFGAVIVYLFVILARAGINFVKAIFLSSTKIRISVEMQSAVMAKILHLPYSAFMDMTSGKISKQINSCSRLSDIILDIFLDVLLNLFFAIAYLVQLDSSALDNLTQTKVLRNIEKMNSTVIMVAHRLSTVECYDRISMLEAGKIAEEGSYEELMEKDGRFAQFVRRQLT